MISKRTNAPEDKKRLKGGFTLADQLANLGDLYRVVSPDTSKNTRPTNETLPLFQQRKVLDCIASEPLS